MTSTVGDLYARKSTTDAGRSVARQERDWRTDCDRETITPGLVFVDPDLSASRFARKPRPGYNDLLTHIRAGNCAMVCLWEASRGSRDLGEWVAFLELCRRHGTLVRVFSDGGRTYDPRRRRDWRDLAEEGLDAHDESARLSERVTAGTRDSAAQGRPPGPLLFGYTRVYDERGKFVEQIIRPDEKVIVRRLVKDTLDGVPLQTQARRLIAEGVPAPGGGVWKGGHISRMLRNPGYQGHRRHLGEVVCRDAWPAIITPDEARQLRTLLEVPGRRAHADSSLRWLLSGAARCGVCGQPLRTRRKDVYTCVAAGCMKVAARRVLMDEAVEWAIRERLRRPDAASLFAADVDDEAIATARRELADLTEHLDGMYAQAAARKLSAAGLVAVEARVLPQIAAVEERIRRLSTPPALAALAGVDVAAEWPDLPVATRREVIMQVADVVLVPVGKGGRWSVWRLAPSRWRGDELTWGDIWRRDGFGA